MSIVQLSWVFLSVAGRKSESPMKMLNMASNWADFDETSSDSLKTNGRLRQSNYAKKWSNQSLNREIRRKHKLIRKVGWHTMRVCARTFCCLHEILCGSAHGSTTQFVQLLSLVSFMKGSMDLWEVRNRWMNTARYGGVVAMSTRECDHE